MRRKPGALTQIELSILDAALSLRSQGEGEFYGFKIANEIREKKQARLLTARGTLYRALWRLEEMGFLQSRWEDPAIAAEDVRPRRKYYEITPAGAATIPAAIAEGTGTSQFCWTTSE